GKKNNRLKDQELILRFLALYFNYENYEKPMVEFLNKFISRHKQEEGEFLSRSEEVFTNTIDLAFESFGANAFRPETTLNAAVFDSVMVGLAKRIDEKPVEDISALLEAYSSLFEDEEYRAAIFAATSNERSVETRINKTIQAFRNI